MLVVDKDRHGGNTTTEFLFNAVLAELFFWIQKLGFSCMSRKSFHMEIPLCPRCCFFLLFSSLVSYIGLDDVTQSKGS